MHEIPIPDPCLVVLIGAAGSGKSTFAARHFAPDEVLSSDAYRQRLTGDAADQRATGLAFRWLHGDLEARLMAGRTTVVDATNVTRHARRVLLARAMDADVPSVAVVFDLARAVVHARNAGRTARIVPADVVDDHLDRLRDALEAPPGRRLHDEGFAAIVILADPDEIDRISLVRRRA